ncbi:MFS transporter [Streptacidiphilus pinicola]|uniref:MFS transporter n=1 Tax=Streptacidiphilus pinicola TaxID=2219663 RepID=A0A2X0IVK4_9ACTN|nr:oligopeptide:H+ symporter [Streptacidiphilus pinicola]RAG87471.1 MFS transporter [Streptacidiphilus pinicola]
MAQDVATGQGTGPGHHHRTFFGHPWGLATLFTTEMWERFSYYGMRALLVLYLTASPDNGGLGFSTSAATAIYSVYVSMVYLLTLPGGWVADRVWGPRKTVAVAGGVIMIGHFLLALPATASFFGGLVFIALGSGLLKANISTMVGQLYEGPTDPRRDGGFTVFYMGINVGAFFAPLVIGTVGQKVNWHLGFALAGIGMGIGLIIYLFGMRTLSPQSSVVATPLSPEERRSVLRKGLFWLAIAAVFYGIVAGTGHFTLNWATIPLTVIGLVFPAWTLYRIKHDRDLSPLESQKMTGYIWFFVAAAIFWMIYDQGGSTLNIFAQDNTASSLAGVHFPSSWFQSLNPLYIMALGPVFAWLWQWLAAKQREPETATKFSIGLVLVGLSFAVFLGALAAASGGAKVTPLWLCAIYLIQTVGELCLSPVGLSVTTKLAPEKYGSQMMGVWFLAVTAGDCITSLATTAGADLNSRGYVAAEVALALVAAAAIMLNRGKIRSHLGEVR